MATNNPSSLANNGQLLTESLQGIVELVSTSTTAIGSGLVEVKNLTTNGFGAVENQINQVQQNLVENQLNNAANVSAKTGGLASGLVGSLFLSPLWKGLASLFGGGDGGNPVKLTPFQSSSPAAIDQPASVGRISSPASTNSLAANPELGSSRGVNNVNITIQALDARSIADRSEDIAAAVRMAILSGSNINESVNEL